MSLRLRYESPPSAEIIWSINWRAWRAFSSATLAAEVGAVGAGTGVEVWALIGSEVAMPNDNRSADLRIQTRIARSSDPAEALNGHASRRASVTGMRRNLLSRLLARELRDYLRAARIAPQRLPYQHRPSVDV